jgi:hypothetical protein
MHAARRAEYRCGQREESNRKRSSSSEAYECPSPRQLWLAIDDSAYPDTLSASDGARDVGGERVGLHAAGSPQG